MKTALIFLLTVTLMIAVLGLFTRNADAYVLTLDEANPGIAAFPSPYATVTINDFTNSNTATVTFTGLSNSSYIYLLGDQGIANLNVNATDFSVGSFSWTGGDSGTAIPISITSGNVDGFGNFNLSIDASDGFNSAVDTLTFTVTNNSGTWSDAASVLAVNGSGYEAATHIFVANADGTNTGITGYATNSGGGDGHSVPEPNMLLMLGSGFVGLAILRKKLIRRGQVITSSTPGLIL